MQVLYVLWVTWCDQSSDVLGHALSVCLLLQSLRGCALSALLTRRVEPKGIMQDCCATWQLFPNPCTGLLWSTPCGKQGSLTQRCFSVGMDANAWYNACFPVNGKKESVLWLGPGVAICDRFCSIWSHVLHMALKYYVLLHENILLVWIFIWVNLFSWAKGGCCATFGTQVAY